MMSHMHDRDDRDRVNRPPHMPGAYGKPLIESLGFDNGSALIARCSNDAIIAATVCRLQTPSHAPTRPLAREDALLAEIHLSDQIRRDVWLDGKRAETSHLLKNEVCIHDLRRELVYQFHTPLDSISVYLPRKTLDFIADDVHAPRLADVAILPGVGVGDPTLTTMARILLPALEPGSRVSKLFSDHVMMAAAVHIAETYGGLKPFPRRERGGLAPWQERRAKEILIAFLDGELPIALLASECELSVSHFSRRFKRSTGLAPHQWLVQHRIEIAKKMLCETQRSLSEIALACGFSDQSHFTRTYTRLNGESPGAARRAMAKGSDRRPLQ
jgi:AraC family transcriptional regulator